MTDTKILDKLAKLQRHAESAKTIGSEAEAQAFAEMIQKLVLDHKLSMSDVEFASMEKESPIEEHRINYSLYPDVKLRKTRVQWIQDLAGIVAEANFCRILVYRDSSRITFVGRREDTAVAEFLFVTLHRSAEKISASAYGKFRYEERMRQIKLRGVDDWRGELPATFGFRESFLLGFLNRLRDRLREKQNERTSGDNCTALVRVQRSSKAVDDYLATQNRPTAKALSNHVTFNREGMARGRAAADAINLNANAIERTKTAAGRIG